MSNQHERMKELTDVLNSDFNDYKVLRNRTLLYVMESEKLIRELKAIIETIKNQTLLAEIIISGE